MNKKPTPKVNANEVKFKAIIAQTVSEILHDPDFGKELSIKTKERLSLTSNRGVKETTPLSEIKKKYL
jgi:hypothetical protein